MCASTCMLAWATLSPFFTWPRLAIQVEENEMLKAALGSALRGKEEDFRMYHETLGQVKGVFLQALRQQKADTTRMVARGQPGGTGSLRPGEASTAPGSQPGPTS